MVTVGGLALATKLCVEPRSTRCLVYGMYFPPLGPNTKSSRRASINIITTLLNWGWGGRDEWLRAPPAIRSNISFVNVVNNGQCTHKFQHVSCYQSDDAALLWQQFAQLFSPVKGSAGRSDSLLLDEKDDLTGTGKNPLRKRAMPNTSNIRNEEAKTDERILILLIL